MKTSFRSRSLFVAAGLLLGAISLAPVYAQFGRGRSSEAETPTKDEPDQAVAGFGIPQANSKVLSVQGVGVVALVAEQQDRVWGYSAEKGEWRSQTVHGAPVSHGGGTSLSPTVGSDMVSVQTTGHVYGFSGNTASWDDLVVPEDAKVSVAHQHAYLYVTFDDTVAMFSAKTGRWSALDWKTGKTLD